MSSSRLNKLAKKRALIQGGELPEDILVQVLSRVPAKDLLLYRSVSKIWRSMIDDPKFVSSHLENYNKNSEESHLLVINGPSMCFQVQALIRRGDTFRKVKDLRLLHGSDVPIYYKLSYVDGVVLIRKAKVSSSILEFILWNPSINGSLKLPNTNSLYESLVDATYFELGFGYSASSNDYKVVAIVYPKAKHIHANRLCFRAMVPGIVHVYSLSNNSWGSNLGVSPPPYWTAGKQVFVHGAIHWINIVPNNSMLDDRSYKNRDISIVSFDVENEVFIYFEVPKGMEKDDEPKEKSLTILHGSLSIFCIYENSRNDIWVMKDYGVTESWTKCYTFTLRFDRLLHISNNGRLIFAVVGEGVKSYDLKSNKVRDLARTYPKYDGYSFFTYVESLVLSKELAKCRIEPTN